MNLRTLVNSLALFASVAALLASTVVPRPALAVTNLALGKAATQSSLSWDAPAGRAVDGNTDGNFWNGSVTHTGESDPAPWWRVDLGAPYTISGITIHNRTDCCQDRNDRIAVSVSHDGVSYTPLWTNPGTVANSYLVPLTGPLTARYVKIDLNQHGYLSLAEVEVFGDVAAPLPPLCTGDCPSGSGGGMASTPELGSLALFGSGALGFGSYAWSRVRGIRRKGANCPD